MENQIVEKPTEQLPAERVVSYVYKDANLPDDYPIFHADARAWWMDGGLKLNQLLSCFKRGYTVLQSCYITGISYDQYRSFRVIHDWLPQVIRIYKQLIPLRLKDIILEAAIGNEKLGKKPNAKMALGAIRVFPDIEEDPDFAIQQKGIAIPEGGALATYTQQAMTDENGKVIMKKKTLEIYEREHPSDGGTGEI